MVRTQWQWSRHQVTGTWTWAGVEKERGSLLHPTEHLVCTLNTSIHLWIQIHRQTHTPSKALAFCSYRRGLTGKCKDSFYMSLKLGYNHPVI